MADVKHFTEANKNFTLKHPVEAVGLKYAGLGIICMVIYFFVMRMLHLIQHPELRFINYLILAAIIYFALKEERRLENQKRLEYFPGIGTGLITSTIAAMGFSIFVFIYAKLDPSILGLITKGGPFSDYINAYTLGPLIFGETLIWGGIATFILMQLFKRNKVRTGA